MKQISSVLHQIEAEEKTQNELNNKKILIKESGSIAEASLKLSDIFKSADEAVQIYIKNAQEQMKKEERQKKKELTALKKKMLDYYRKLKIRRNKLKVSMRNCWQSLVSKLMT